MSEPKYNAGDVVAEFRCDCGHELEVENSVHVGSKSQYDPIDQAPFYYDLGCRTCRRQYRWREGDAEARPVQGREMGSPLRQVKEWRAADEHTGIGNVDGIPYTYQHAQRPEIATSRAEVYRIEAFVEYVEPTPLHRNTYFVPASRLNEFFKTWGEHGETIVDVRPVTLQEALREIRDLQSAAAGEGA
jgi:hypothetical protein